MSENLVYVSDDFNDIKLIFEPKIEADIVSDDLKKDSLKLMEENIVYQENYIYRNIVPLFQWLRDNANNSNKGYVNKCEYLVKEMNYGVDETIRQLDRII